MHLRPPVGWAAVRSGAVVLLLLTFCLLLLPSCNCSMFCFALLYVHSSIAIILMGKRKLVALINLSSWCLVVVGRLFLAVPRGCLQFLIVVFPDHTHLLFFKPFSKIFLLTVPRRYFFCGSLMLFLSCVCYAFVRACLLLPCGHLLGKG